MLNRRKFLQQSGSFTLGSLLLAKPFSDGFFNAAAMPPPGLQLFTFFGLIEKDVPGTLKKIADIGYKNIESAFSMKGGFYGYKAKEFSALLKDLGLSWKSHHVLGAPFKMPAGSKMPTGPDGKPITIPPMRNLRDNFQELVDEAAEAGIPYLVCANIPTETLDEVKSSIITLNKTGEAAKKAGLVLAYHNHDMEFKKLGDKTAYDLLLSETDPSNLKFELDLCWVTKAGVDPLELFKKNPGRFPLWHVKDIDKDFKGPQPVGTGVVDFKRIFTAADTAGLVYYFVEHDMPADAFQSITMSMENLRKIVG